MLIRWYNGHGVSDGLPFFYGQFCIALDKCRAMIRGRSNFPFSSELFCLFFERFPETRPIFSIILLGQDSCVDAHVGGDDAQEGPGGVSSQDCARHTRATRQCDRSHVRHGVVSLRGLDWRGCPTSSSQQMSHQMIEVILVFCLN
jgi:hypothetical protein